VDLTQRVEACRGNTVEEIAAAFEGDDQDEITEALVRLIAERTDAARLPKRPYRVGFTMYGDDGVSEWVITHDASDGSQVEPWDGEAEVDLPTRWEHWEDAVRLLNGDLSGLSLYYARRVNIGEEPTMENELPWLRAVDFAPGSQALAEHRIITGLVDATEAGGSRGADEYVQRVGIQAITESRTFTVARALLESGCADQLKGSYMAVTISEEPEVLAVSRFEEGGVTTGDQSAIDKPDGVLLHYASRQTILDAATGARSFQDLLVNGQVKIEGTDEARGRFAATLMHFARLHGS
jgi:hypothetical protein